MISLRIVKTQGAFTLDAAFEAGGGVTALFGRSGAGKSTIVKAIAGLVRPESGHIRIAGETLFDSAAGIDVPAHRRRAGVVFQDGRLFPHLTVKQNLLYGYARAPGEKTIASEGVIAVLGLDKLLERRPATLSGGERQRVAIARALLSQPRHLLMDEPLASLDAARKSEVLPFLEDLNTRFRIPILYVTHDIDEVLRLADHLVLIAGGKTSVSGPLAEVTGRLDLPEEAEVLGLGAVLDATVEAHDAARGLTALGTPVGTFWLPLLQRPLGARLALRIAARDVALALDRPAAISVQNIFGATVEEMRAPAPHIVRLRLKIGGGHLLAEVTADAAARLALQPGAPVTALIKSVALAR